ncbi:sortase [Erysipelothrix aquatica]|uniref:sortase n=1 Tax=Erysipelothrix aquatica TaxID=2683714 RepID=UPI0013597A56|nr:sortase [Erysipelothrix aquatica]
MEKKKKVNVLGIIGILMTVLGLSIIVYDVGIKYFERKSQEQELQNFMNAPLLSENSELPAETVDANVWGYIVIEKLGVNHLIAKTNDWNYLSRYVVAYESSPEPTGNGNFAIAGHNGNCASCVFRDFDKLEIGDEVILNDKKNTYTYRIEDISTVHHTDVSVLNDTPDSRTLTLITCTEQTTVDPWRTIVKATQISEVPNT